MKTFTQFQRALVNEGFKFSRISEKPFGKRIIALKEGTFSDKTYLLYLFTKKQPTISDFDKFLDDFKHLVDESQKDIETGFFLVSEKCREETIDLFKVILKHAPDKIQEKIKVQQLKLTW
jgi:hypothetical protein